MSYVFISGGAQSEHDRAMRAKATYADEDPHGVYGVRHQATGPIVSTSSSVCELLRVQEN